MKNARQVVVVAKKETLTNFLSQSSKLETRGLATIIVALNQGGKNETLNLTKNKAKRFAKQLASGV